jgi:hypothetical protein
MAPASVFGWLATCSGVGGTRRPRLAPKGETGKGEIHSLLPQGISAPQAELPLDVQLDLSDRFPHRSLAIERGLDPLPP